MAENPNTWTELEWLINDALVPEQGSVAGLSTPRRIADAIRAHYDLVKKTDAEDGHEADV